MNQTSILIALRENIIGDYYKDNLRDIGYNVKLVCDGKSAIETAKKELPDIILLDGKFYDLDGIDVCRELKSDDETKGIKIIINTMGTTHEDIKMYLDAGANLYIAAPHTLSVIKKVIADAVSNPKFPGEEIQKIDDVYAPKA